MHGADLARFIALIGIMVNHVFLLTNDTIAHVLQDYHAITFLLLAGVIFSYTKERDNGRTTKLVTRVVFFLLIGFALGSGNPEVDVILVNYGLIFLIGIFLVPVLSTRWLAVVTVIWTLISPIASFAIRSVTVDEYVGPNVGAQMLNEPWMMIVDPVLFSHYPVIQWFSVFLIGALIGRGYNALPHKMIWSPMLAGIGLFLGTTIISYSTGADVTRMNTGNVSTDSWTNLLESGAYAGTTLSIIASVGVAVFIIGLSTALCELSVFRKLSLLGTYTLTAYTLHVLLFTLTPLDWLMDNQVLFFVLNVVMIVVMGIGWRTLQSKTRVSGTGPIEAVVEHVAKTEQQKREQKT